MRQNCPTEIGFSKKGMFLKYRTQKQKILWDDVKDIRIDNDLYFKMQVIVLRNGEKYPLIYFTKNLTNQVLEQFKNYKVS
jgi:hypothetical protein